VNDLHRIVIAGGGAGGLELATKLGARLGRHGKAEITLLDAARTHIWKPLLHEVAAGTLDSHQDELEYLAQAHRYYFRFRLGRVDGIDREERVVSVAPTLSQGGEEIIPRQRIAYDTLVVAVGSVSNDFGIDGVEEHCLFLDTKAQAEAFQARLVEAFLYAQSHSGPEADRQLQLAIVGGGATGVELAAQLYDVARQFTTYGAEIVEPDRELRIAVIEAAERILPALPERISKATREELEKLGTRVIEDERVVAVTEEGIRTASGETVPCGIKVWAAGIKAPEFLGGIDWLETNARNQIVVGETLCSVSDENALGGDATFPFRRARRRRISRPACSRNPSSGACEETPCCPIDTATTARSSRWASTAPSATSWGGSSAPSWSKVTSPDSCISRSTRCTSSRSTA